MVLARNHKSYREFLFRNNHLNPSDFYYVGRRSQLLGISYVLVGGVVYWEGWEGNPAYDREFIMELEYQFKKWKFINEKRIENLNEQAISYALDRLRETGIRVIRV